MEYNNSRLGGTESAITVTTKIIHSEAPLRDDTTGLRRRSPCRELEQRQHKNAEGPSRSKQGPRTVPTSIRNVDPDETCASPVIHDKRIHKAHPPVGLRSGFEESPEWRQHYDPSSNLSQAGRPHPLDDESRLFPHHSLTNPTNFSRETVITAKTLSERSSIDKAELGSKKLICLPHPPARRNLLKTGQIRLKNLIKPTSKSYFRTQPFPEDEESDVEHHQKLKLTSSKKGLRRRGSKAKMDQVAKDRAAGSQKAVRNRESSSSIVDLNQVEARHGLDRDHRSTLSDSWDEIFKTMGGFGADPAVGSVHTHQNGPSSQATEIDVIKSDRPNKSTSPKKYETIESRKLAAKSLPLPGPRTPSISAMVDGSPTRQSFQVLVAELPTQSSPTRRSEPKSPNQEHFPIESNLSFLQGQGNPEPQLRAAQTFEGASIFGPAPNASQSTIALEAIEAEMINGRPLSPSVLTKLAQPFSINRTPPQPETAPTDPPIGPLPDLPEEFDRADAASRASSHPSLSTRLSRPIVPPRSHHRNNPSTNSTSSSRTLRAMHSPKGSHSKQASISNRSPKKASSIRSVPTVPPEGTSHALQFQPVQVSPVSNGSNVIDFNQYNLGNSQDLRSPTASETGQESDMADALINTSAKASLLSNDVLSSRSEHIKGLKLKDLARERATRVRSRNHGSGLDDTIVVEKPYFVAEEEVKTSTSELSKFPPVPSKPSKDSRDIQHGGSRPASRQDNVNQRPSYQSRRRSSNRVSQKTLRPLMNQSQIMVLAETNPDTQTFRASTPTGSIGRTDTKKAESLITARERRLKKRKSKTSIRSQVHIPAVASGTAAIKPTGQHTPPLSDPSTHSSDDEDVESMRRSKSCRGISHIAALVREDSDIESAPSKRAFAALARKEEKRYFKEQLLLKKLKREGSDLKLAIRLLNRGLEKLTTFVEAEDELDAVEGHGLIEAEIKSVKGMAERFGRSLSPRDWETFENRPSGYDDTRRCGKDGQDVGFRRAKSSRADDARPVSLVSRYSSVRNSMGESVIAGPPIRDEMIWDQVDGLNRVGTLSGGSFR